MAQVPYSQGVADVAPQSGGTGATYGDVPQANAAAFGGGIGEAEQKAGGQLQETGNKTLDLAAHFAEMATTSKAENDFASQYATGAAALRQKFDMAPDQDKVAASVEYLNGLNNLGQSFTGDNSQGSPLYKQVMGHFIAQHAFSETNGINRDVVDSTMRLSAQSKDAMIAANNGYINENYDNQTIVDQNHENNKALRTLQYMDAGHDPTTPQGAASIAEAQRNDTGMMANGMVNAAIAKGDIASAMRIRGTYNDAIPGYQQLAQDSLIHAVGMQQFAGMGNSALAAGQPIPQVPGAPPATVQAVVANTANANGVNPNDALTVARIESSMGTNVGSRGTIGQDKGSAGQPLNAQAKALCDNWKAAHDPAATAVGREPQGWEQYVVYQQGIGGGVALLKANPNAKAVDVISSLYSSPKLALEAITNNGGNAAMSVSDFLDQEKQRWTDNAARANCDFNGTTPPGDQIMAAHQTPGAMVQPAANPAQDYRNWQRANILNMQQIMAMPSGPARDALLKENQFQTLKRETASNSYKGDLVNQASQLAQNPNFTSMQQINPDMHSALLEVSPNTLSYMETRAEYNLKHQGGTVTEDQQKYGSRVNDVLNGIWNGNVKSISTLHDAVANGSLTIAGYDKAAKELDGMNTPEGTGEAKLREQTFKAVRSMIMGKADSFGIPDPHGEETYGHAMALMYQAESKAKETGLTDIYDPNSKNWIGNVARPLVKSVDQRVAELGGGSKLSPDMPPPEKRVVNQIYQSPTGLVKWTEDGWVRSVPPNVPLEQ